MKKKVLLAALAVLVPLGALLITARVFYPDNVAETAPDGGAKGLRTRVYAKDAETVERAVREIVPTLSSWGSNWKLTDPGTKTGGTTVIRAEVPVVVFTDDLTVTIRPAENGEGFRVDVRSASRVGKSDFGENRRHVVKFLDALDGKLK